MSSSDRLTLVSTIVTIISIVITLISLLQPKISSWIPEKLKSALPVISIVLFVWTARLFLNQSPLNKLLDDSDPPAQNEQSIDSSSHDFVFFGDKNTYNYYFPPAVVSSNDINTPSPLTPTPPPTPSPTPSPTPTPPPSPSPVAVTVRVRDQQRFYDGKPQRLDQNAYTVEGLRDGDTLSVKLYIEDAEEQILGEVTDAGSYNISAEIGSYDPQKYQVEVDPGVLTVKPAELSITASSETRTWDGTSSVQTTYEPNGLLADHRFRAADGVIFAAIDSDGNTLSAWHTEAGTYIKKVTDVHIVDGNGREVTNNYHITRIDGTITIKPTPTPPPTSKPTTKSTPTPTPKPSYPGTAWTPPDGSSPSRQDLDSVKNNKKYPNNIVYPQSSSYLSTYEVMYVKSGLGHSIYLFWDPKCTMDTKRNHYVYEGDAVTVIAREGSASCIIYMNPEGHAISGWVDSGFLVY